MVGLGHGQRALPARGSRLRSLPLSLQPWAGVRGLGPLSSNPPNLAGHCRCDFSPESSLDLARPLCFGRKVAWLGVVLGHVRGA